jgi:hypothetical protein
VTSLDRVTRVAAAGVATALVLGLIVWSSAAPIRFHDDAAAHLRLSWSARPERIEVCRTLSAEELAERAEHMRQRVECDGRFATYALRVESDGKVIGESVVHGGGLRNDRPMHLLREYNVAPGVHRVRVTFTRREKSDDTDDKQRAKSDDDAARRQTTSTEADTGIFAGRAQREAVEQARQARAAIPRHLELDTTLTFAPRRVLIVSFAPERKALLLLAGAGGSR